MARVDVIVVGAGLAGSMTAALLGRQGVQVLLLEQAAFPRPKLVVGWFHASPWMSGSPHLRQLSQGPNCAGLSGAFGSDVQRTGGAVISTRQSDWHS